MTSFSLLRGPFMLVVALAWLSGCATPLSVPQNHSALADLVRQFSEDALGEALPAVLEAGSDCSVPRAEVDQFDALLFLDASQIEDAIETHAPWGLAIGFDTDILLGHPQYLVNYDPTVLLPTWASYTLTAADIVSESRETCFREDIRLLEEQRSTLADYREPVFDRGHLVPRADMNRTRAAMINTFVLSNMMPQHGDFNRGIWATFEALIRVWATQRGTIHVVTGPLFDADDNGQPDDVDAIGRMQPHGNVGIPSHFFKIALHERDNGFIESVTVVLPHTAGEVPQGLSTAEELALLAEGLTSIDVVEKLSGYDFFPAMTPRKQRAVERFVAPALWSD